MQFVINRRKYSFCSQHCLQNAFLTLLLLGKKKILAYNYDIHLICHCQINDASKFFEECHVAESESSEKKGMVLNLRGRIHFLSDNQPSEAIKDKLTQKAKEQSKCSIFYQRYLCYHCCLNKKLHSLVLIG